jgi:hypothetical protein
MFGFFPLVGIAIRIPSRYKQASPGAPENLLAGKAASSLSRVRDDAWEERLRSPKERKMPKYVIEREIPGAGKLSPAEVQGISQKSCSVLNEMGPQIQWLESFVTGDKVYCVYIAPDEAAVREHARRGGFPCNRVSEVKTILDPTTAEG